MVYLVQLQVKAMVSLFNIIVGQYPDSLSTIVVSEGSGSVFRKLGELASANIFRVYYS